MQMTNPGLRLIQEGKSEKRDFIYLFFFTNEHDGRGKTVVQPQIGIKLI